jgi:hypothetical protein
MKADKPVTFSLTLNKQTRVLAFVVQALDTLCGSDRETALRTIAARLGYHLVKA